ncbi:MAG: peptide deformylase [Desulfamplus sp.]|nr:peptide deformylase [Desulfamplus sp.]
MFNAPGVGLAAPQVGSDKRIIVYNPNAPAAERSSDSSIPSDSPNHSDQDDHSKLDQDGSSGKNSGNKNLDNDHVSELKESSSAQSTNRKNNMEEYRAIINPEIIAASGSLISENEACLSVPDYSADVRRFSKVTVRGLNMDGKRIQFDAEDITAVIMQHEIDHLDGVLYIERISILKRNMYKKRVKKRLKNS